MFNQSFKRCERSPQYYVKALSQAPWGCKRYVQIFPLTQDCTTSCLSSLSSNLSAVTCTTFLFLKGVLRFLFKLYPLVGTQCLSGAGLCFCTNHGLNIRTDGGSGARQSPQDGTAHSKIMVKASFSSPWMYKMWLPPFGNVSQLAGARHTDV